MSTQRILPLADADDNAPYFSMILVRRPAQASALAVPDRALPQGAALIVLGAGGMTLARRLQPLLPGSTVHGLAGRADAADQTFAETMAHLRALFAAGKPIVGICAAGILMRAIAPLLADKHARAAGCRRRRGRERRGATAGRPSRS